MPTVSEFQALPGTYKEYTLVRSRKSLRKPTRLDDPNTTHYASLHAALKPERQLSKAQPSAKQQVLAINPESLNAGKLHKSIKAIDEAKEKLKARKMEPESDDVNGHTEDPGKLSSQYKGYSAESFFHNFIWRISRHHDKTGIVPQKSKVMAL